MPSIHRGLIALLSLALASADLTAPQQQPLAFGQDDTVFDADFDRFVEEALQDWHVPGMSIAVVDNGKIESKGYGYAVLPDQNATGDTQYFTGSTTKAFTAAALAQLIYSGEYPDLKWTSPINQFIRSNFVLQDDYATSHTTIEDALSHRSGLPRHDMIYGRAHDTPSSIVQRIRHLPMTAEPRTIWQYCNLMFVVMTDLIETLTGSNLEDILKEKFWKPLGMSSTTFTIPEEADRPKLARGYYWHSPENADIASTGEGEYIPDPYIDLLPIAGAGATISTVNDYALWMKAWLDAADSNGSSNASSPVTNQLVRDLVRPRAIVLPDTDDKPTRLYTPPLYALGWGTMDIFGEKFIAHDGGLTGFGTTLYLMPNKNFGVVTMGNTMGTSNVAGAYIASRLFLGKIGRWETAASSTFQDMLETLPTTHLGPARFSFRHEHLLAALADNSKISPPVPLDGFAGEYSHPGYGNINFAMATASTLASKPSLEILDGGFYDRTWPIKIQLHRLAGSVFAAKLYWAHGLGDVRTGEGIVWEDVGESVAVFEFDLDGKTVERVGIALEGEMVEYAMRKGDGHWRDAMIWFEKS